MVSTKKVTFATPKSKCLHYIHVKNISLQQKLNQVHPNVNLVLGNYEDQQLQK